MKINLPYQGVEQGPIRPPSEAHSLLIRVTRNCPWNQCTFCPLYKDEKFSIRPVEDIKRDIDTIARHIGQLRELAGETGELASDAVRRLHAQLEPEEQPGFEAALHWFVGGMESVFLQDANSLVVKPPRLMEILTHLKAHFPGIRRITSYARSQTNGACVQGDGVLARQIQQVAGRAAPNQAGHNHIGIKNNPHGCRSALRAARTAFTSA